MSWVPLHVHSQYSILNASLSVKDIAARGAAFGMPAVALTDSGNLFGAVDFFKACRSEKIKPIIGLEIALAPESRHEKKRIFGEASGYPLVLLAKDHKGYQNLCKITSAGFLEGFYYTPRIDREFLEQHSQGLIALTGHPASRLASFFSKGKKRKQSKSSNGSANFLAMTSTLKSDAMRCVKMR